MLLCLVLFFGNACKEVKQPEISRQEKYIQENPELSDEMKKLIRNGTVTVGMSEGEVRASWGDPKTVEIFNSGENSYKRWIYGDGKPVLYWKNHKVHKMDKE